LLHALVVGCGRYNYLVTAARQICLALFSKNIESFLTREVIGSVIIIRVVLPIFRTIFH
jgi:hypothetical protein